MYVCKDCGNVYYHSKLPKFPHCPSAACKGSKLTLTYGSEMLLLHRRLIRARIDPIVSHLRSRIGDSFIIPTIIISAHDNGYSYYQVDRFLKLIETLNKGSIGGICDAGDGSVAILGRLASLEDLMDQYESKRDFLSFINNILDIMERGTDRGLGDLRPAHLE
jgi:hypothetical protein